MWIIESLIHILVRLHLNGKNGRCWALLKENREVWEDALAACKPGGNKKPAPPLQFFSHWGRLKAPTVAAGNDAVALLMLQESPPWNRRCCSAFSFEQVDSVKWQHPHVLGSTMMHVKTLNGANLILTLGYWLKPRNTFISFFVRCQGKDFWLEVGTLPQIRAVTFHI